VLKQWAAGHNLKVSSVWLKCLVENLMEELDPNHQGDVNEEEFLLILKYIQ
jgi:hypothetical protein